MINRLDIETRVREWGLREDVVEKDYALGWVLWGIGSDPLLSKAWAFKGGTCLKKWLREGVVLRGRIQPPDSLILTPDSWYIKSINS